MQSARKDILNFVVTGEVRSGASVVQTSVHSHPEATCHGDLLHPAPEMRREVHEAYFGRQHSEEEPGGFFVKHLISAEQYLETVVFDNAMHGEDVIGVKIDYAAMRCFEMWDYMHEKGNVGDFCCVHVRRNPVACYISLKQAKQTGLWYRDINDKTHYTYPTAVDIKPRELEMFVNMQLASETSLSRACEDRLEITYKELFLNYHEVMDGVFEFLELPPFPDVSPGVRRLKNRNMLDRVGNLDLVINQLTPEVRELLDGDDLF